MILIIHGDDIESSRNFYFEEKNKLKNFILLNGENLTYEAIFQNVENKSMFDKEQTLFIENFFIKNKANTIVFKDIASYINSNKNLNIIFWESSEVSKAALSSIKNVTSKLFSYPKTIFIFLDSIKPQNINYLIKLFHDLRKTMEDELIFYMLVRQVRIMINILGSNQKQIDEIKRMAPWQISKLKNQISYFENGKLQTLYSNLFKIELSQKSGKSAESLEKSIDFLLAGL